MTKEEFRLPLSGVDPNGNLKFRTLLEYFQEIADKDASAKGSSLHQMLKQGLTWVLHKYRIEIYRYPTPDDGKFYIKSYTEPYGKLFCLRTFELSDASGASIGRAWTWWVLLDAERMRPVRPEKYELEYDNKAPDSEKQPVMTKLECITEADITEEIKVRWQELDVNRHTNNIVYFDWALDNVPDEVLYDMLPVEVECEYVNSVKKTRVRVESQELPSDGEKRIFLHSVVSLEDGKLSAKLKSVWKDR